MSHRHQRHPSDGRRIVYDDGYRRSDDDYDMRDANAPRGGGSSSRNEGTSRVGQDESPAPANFEPVVMIGSIVCKCGICKRFRDHVAEEGLEKNNPSVERAKRVLGEQLAAKPVDPTASTAKEARLRGERDKARGERDEAKEQVRRLNSEAEDLSREVDDCREEIHRLRDELARVKAAAANAPPIFRGQSRGGRYRDEPSWGYSRREGSPSRKRGLSDAAERDQPPRQQQRRERYEGSRLEHRDERQYADWRERGPPRVEQQSSGRSEGGGSYSASQSKGKERASTPTPTPSTSAAPSGPEHSGTTFPTNDPYLGGDDDDYGSDMSNGSDEPPMTEKKRRDVNQGKAERGTATPLTLRPRPAVDPEARSYLRERMEFIERIHPRSQSLNNEGKTAAQVVFDDLNKRVRLAVQTKRSKRTPYQHAVAPFASLPRVQGVAGRSGRRPPGEEDGLAQWLLYALQSHGAMPRGVRVVTIPRTNNIRAVPTSQVRTLMTWRRMLPSHNDMQSSAAAADHFEFMTRFAIAVADIATQPPPVMHPYAPGYASHLVAHDLLNSSTPRVLRRWDRNSDGQEVNSVSVTRFLHSVGISIAEFNDMLPFTAQLLWDNVIHGVDTDASTDAFCRLRDVVVEARGVWPTGLPGPTHLVDRGDTNSRWLWAHPQLPGDGQPFLVFTGSAEGRSTRIADPNHSRTLPLEVAQKCGFATGINTTPWPAASSQGPSEAPLAGEQPLPDEDSVMVDAPAATTSTTSTGTGPADTGAADTAPEVSTTGNEDGAATTTDVPMEDAEEKEKGETGTVNTGDDAEDAAKASSTNVDA